LAPLSDGAAPYVEWPEPTNPPSEPFNPWGDPPPDPAWLELPFRFGVAGLYYTFPGSRPLPPGFNPVFADRFPGLNQADVHVGLGISLGLAYQTPRAGTIALNHRLIFSNDTVAYLVPGGPQDLLVLNFLNDSKGDDEDSRPRVFYVPDSVGSCLVSSRFTLNQTDLTYSPPVWRWNGESSFFGAVGARGVTLVHEDSTNSTFVFQQAKDSYYGAGPVVALGLASPLRETQFYARVEGGSLFGSGSSLTREMVVDQNATTIQAVQLSGFRSVPMLGAEVGFTTFSTRNSVFVFAYRFDYWWNLGGVGGGRLDWNRHQLGVEFRRRF
jgi:hypothetical protein